MERQTDDQLSKNGLVAELTYKTAKVKEAELANRDEIEKKRAEGSLSVDWTLTDAALKLQFGQIAQAADMIRQARANDEHRLGTLFASCISDMLFTGAANKHPEIAEACRVTGGEPVPSPNPFTPP